MKKLVLIAMLALALAASSFAQGLFLFDNSSRYDGTANSYLPFISFLHRPGEGETGQIVGSDPTHATPNYDISFLWMPGTTFAGDSLTPIQFLYYGASFGSLTTSFAAPTGDTLHGAGIVGGGATFLPGTGDGELITVQLVVWYDPTGTTSLASVLSRSSTFTDNMGCSILMPIRLAAGGDVNFADLSSFPAFAVLAGPEPTTFALAGLGGLCLWLFRRRQS